MAAWAAMRIDMAIISSELAYRSADLSMAFGGSVFCGLNVLRKGTEEQKRYWLPKLLKGEIKMTISMSEPDAGSDIGAMRTNARREGNQWVVNGQKLWATGAAARNNVINMYVKTDTAAHYRQGMSLILIDNNTPGIEMRKLDMLGRRCVGTYEIFLSDVRVPGDRIVGGENKGWDVVLAGLQIERVTAAAGSCGAAQAIVDLALAYAKERKQFGRPIGTFQAIAHMLADMETEVAAALEPDVARGVAGRQGRAGARRKSPWPSSSPPRPTSRSRTRACRCWAATATTWNSTCSAISAIRAPRPSPPARRRSSATCWPT